MNTQSPTPETDAQRFDATPESEDLEPLMDCVSYDFARTLERQRNGAIAAREEALNHVYGVAAERDQALKDLAHVTTCLDASTKACDKARDERAALQRELQSAINQRDGFLQAVDALKVEVLDLNGSLKCANETSHRRGEERDDLQEEYKAVGERNELRRCRDVLLCALTDILNYPHDTDYAGVTTIRAMKEIAALAIAGGLEKRVVGTACVEACQRIAKDFADGSFDGVTVGAIEDAVAAAKALES